MLICAQKTNNFKEQFSTIFLNVMSWTPYFLFKLWTFFPQNQSTPVLSLLLYLNVTDLSTGQMSDTFSHNPQLWKILLGHCSSVLLLLSFAADRAQMKLGEVPVLQGERYLPLAGQKQGCLSQKLLDLPAVAFTASETSEEIQNQLNIAINLQSYHL